jgi:hypothetical protein
MSGRLSSELASHFKGLKRATAEQIARGERPIKVGKDPLPFSLYRFLGNFFMGQKTREFSFAHCFMTMCWNLMCRSRNAVLIKFNHLEWSEDAMCVYFAHQKTDQSGEKPRDPRHIYPNPMMPEICPVLSLGLFLLCFKSSDSISLFPGNNQYDRFRKILRRASNIEQVKIELERRSINPEDLGTHSMRKGATTYCSSGNTAGPPSNAIHLRAGWAMGGVQDTYIRYEAAGDMYVGRVVSGLPINSSDFDVVGPLFSDSASQHVVEYLKIIFPGIHAEFMHVAENILASLVYHADFLQETLHPSHPAKQSILFRDSSVLATLRPLVVCSLQNRVHISPTGIPPHTSLLRELATVTNRVNDVIPAINARGQQVVNDLIDVLEDRAIGAGTVTRDGLQQILAAEFERFMGIQNMATTNDVSSLHQDVVQNSLFTWEEGLRRLPQDFELPTGTVLAAFRCWALPDTSKGICALKHCSAADFSSKNQKKRFSDLAKLMTMIEDSSQTLTNAPNIEEVDSVVEQWEQLVELPSSTPKGRIRRIGQLKWTSVLQMIRKMN